MCKLIEGAKRNANQDYMMDNALEAILHLVVVKELLGFSIETQDNKAINI